MGIAAGVIDATRMPRQAPEPQAQQVVVEMMAMEMVDVRPMEPAETGLSRGGNEEAHQDEQEEKLGEFHGSARGKDSDIKKAGDQFGRRLDVG